MASVSAQVLRLAVPGLRHQLKQARPSLTQVCEARMPEFVQFHPFRLRHRIDQVWKKITDATDLGFSWMTGFDLSGRFTKALVNRLS